jgi:hypothetical protein
MITRRNLGVHRGANIRLAVILSLVVGWSVVAAVPTSATTIAKPTGQPIILFNEVQSYSELPDVPVGAQAAARAINAAGGIKDPSGGPNRPIKVVECQEGLTNPSAGAAACGREAVSDAAVAAVGTDTIDSTIFDPIVFAAGIPDVPAEADSSPQILEPLSFPITDVLASAVGYPFLAKALGVTKVFPMTLDVPGESFSEPFSTTKVQDLAGVKQVGTSTIIGGNSATPDFTPNAAAFVASDAKLTYFDIGPQGVLLMKALASQGVNFKSTAVVGDTNVVASKTLAPLGSHKNGLYFIGNSFPATYTQYKGVAEFNQEIDKYGDVPGIGNASTPRTEAEEASWADVQVVAQGLAHAQTISAAGLVAALKKIGPEEIGALPPFDFQHPAFPSTGPFATLSHLRIFTDDMMVSREVDGSLVPCVNGFVPVAEPFKITNPACKLS